MSVALLTAVQEQPEAKEVAAQLHLHAHDLFWANLRVQLHLPPLDLAWNPVMCVSSHFLVSIVIVFSIWGSS